MICWHATAHAADSNKIKHVPFSPLIQTFLSISRRLALSEGLESRSSGTGMFPCGDLLWGDTFSFEESLLSEPCKVVHSGDTVPCGVFFFFQNLIAAVLKKTKKKKTQLYPKDNTSWHSNSSGYLTSVNGSFLDIYPCFVKWLKFVICYVLFLTLSWVFFV